MQQWRAGKRPPLAALNNPRLKRKVVIRALEVRHVREEAERRGLVPDPQATRALLSDALAGRAPGPPDAQLDRGADLPLDIDARLAARYETDPARVRQVVADLLLADLLARALTDELPEATAEAAWRRKHTQRAVELVRIPRVPTTAELDRAVVARADQFKAWYDAHPRLFKTPARRLVRRLVIPAKPEPGQTPEAAKAAARAQAETLRAQVAAGQSLEAVARAWGKTDEARQGGASKTVTEKRQPVAFTLKDGELSPVVDHPRGAELFVVEAAYPEVVRPLDKPVVQREIAAAILREADDLPSAMARARQAAARLKAGDALDTLKDLEGGPTVRVSTSELFNEEVAPRVPGVGLAPELFEAIKTLKPGEVSTPVHVRQNYVVARLTRLEAPAADGWGQAREAFLKSWKRGYQARAVDAWLDGHFKGMKLWVDDKALARLTPEAMLAGSTAADAPTAAPPGAPAPPPPPGDRDAAR